MLADVDREKQDELVKDPSPYRYRQIREQQSGLQAAQNRARIAPVIFLPGGSHIAAQGRHSKEEESEN